MAPSPRNPYFIIRTTYTLWASGVVYSRTHHRITHGQFRKPTTALNKHLRYWRELVPAARDLTCRLLETTATEQEAIEFLSTLLHITPDQARLHLQSYREP